MRRANSTFPHMKNRNNRSQASTTRPTCSASFRRRGPSTTVNARSQTRETSSLGTAKPKRGRPRQVGISIPNVSAIENLTSQSPKDLTIQVRVLQAQLTEVHKKLRKFQESVTKKNHEVLYNGST
ncbi:hypothetical protein ACE6H2_016096 [Prunus campanulata]